MFNRGYSLAGFVLLGLAGGCADAEPAVETLGSKQEAIWNGQMDTAAMNGYRNAVVRLTNKADGRFCTGFYVTSTLIVTAAHCNVGALPSGPPAPQRSTGSRFPTQSG